MSDILENFPSICTKIIGVGPNYRGLITDLGIPVPSEPFIFIKPPSAIVLQPNDVKILPEWGELIYEVELGVIIGKPCKNISKEEAEEYIGGYCLTLDMASTGIHQARKQGLPWLVWKGFDTSCPCGDFIDKKQINLNSSVNLWLSVNGELRQNGHTNEMTFSIPELISFTTKYITLERGDIIITGTPAGIGPVKRGDQIEAGLNAENGFKYKMKFNVS